MAPRDHNTALDGADDAGAGPLGASVTITKLEAARRQLHTAIRLFLADGDAVSIHTLTVAAHEIFRTLLKAKGGRSLLKDNDFIRPEHQKDFEKLMNQDLNFFKHAGLDANAVLIFPPQITEFWLIDCCTMFRDLTGKLSREDLAFAMWFSLERPDYFYPQFQATLRAWRDAGTVRKISKASLLQFIHRPDLYPVKADWLEDNQGRS